MLPQNWQLQGPGVTGLQKNQNIQVHASQQRLQSLQMERERLKQRQAEIRHQVRLDKIYLFNYNVLMKYN